MLARRDPDGSVEVAGAGPVKHDGVFELGSITKAVTGLLLADAVVRGEVALDTRLEECLPGARPRGRRMRYSNFGAALLGQALAARAGAPYDELVEERVLRPLGVGEVWARGAPDLVSRTTAAVRRALKAAGERRRFARRARQCRSPFVFGGLTGVDGDMRRQRRSPGRN